MRVRNVHHGLVHVAGLTIAPRRVGEIDDSEWQDWLKRSAGNREVAASCLELLDTPPAPPAESSDDRIPLAVEAIRGLSLEDESVWTGDGKPAVTALRQISGLHDLTSAERDEAWAIVSEAA